MEDFQFNEVSPRTSNPAAASEIELLVAVNITTVGLADRPLANRALTSSVNLVDRVGQVSHWFPRRP